MLVGGVRKALTADTVDTIRLDSKRFTGPEAALACAQTVARVTAFTASGRICQQPYGVTLDTPTAVAACKVFP